MKKFFSVSLCTLALLVLMLSLAACGNEYETFAPSGPSDDAASGAENASTLNTYAPTEAPTSEITSEIPSESASAPSDAPSDTPSASTPTEAPTMDPLLAPFEELDFGGAEIVIALSQYVPYDIPRKSYQYIQGPESQGADTVLNAVYERNLQVEEALGISPRYVLTNLVGYDDIATNIAMNNNMPANEGPDLYIDQVCGMIRAQMEGRLMNVKTKARKNHFDFGDDKTKNANGYYNAYMHGFNFASDEKMYLLAGDYFTDVARQMTLTAVNLSSFKEVFYKGDSKRPELGMGTDYLYNTVEAGEWTVDKMIEWSAAGGVYKDHNNNSQKDKDDRLGVLVYEGGYSAVSLLPSMDVSLYQVSEDGTQYKVGQSQQAFDAISKWQEAFASHGVYLMKWGDAPNGNADLIKKFAGGDVLFALGVQLYQLENEELKGMTDNVCLIPYPKLHASDPYCVTVSDTACVGGVFVNTADFEAVSAWVQASSVTSRKVLDEYCNVLLTPGESGEFGSVTMLDIAFANIANPKWIVEADMLSSTGNAIEPDLHPTDCSRVTRDKSNYYVSKYAMSEQNLRSALGYYQKTFNGLD